MAVYLVTRSHILSNFYPYRCDVQKVGMLSYGYLSNEGKWRGTSPRSELYNCVSQRNSLLASQFSMTVNEVESEKEGSAKGLTVSATGSQ